MIAQNRFIWLEFKPNCISLDKAGRLPVTLWLILTAWVWFRILFIFTFDTPIQYVVCKDVTKTKFNMLQSRFGKVRNIAYILLNSELSSFASGDTLASDWGSDEPLLLSSMLSWLLSLNIAALMWSSCSEPIQKLEMSKLTIRHIV